MTNLDLRQVRAIVTDAEVLGQIEPGAIWTHWLDDTAIKVFAPDDRAAANFAPRLGVLLAAVAVAGDRSQLAVLVDLYAGAAPADVRRDDRPSAAEVEP